MIDWGTAVGVQYGIAPTAAAVPAACAGWGWACELIVDPVQGVTICSITVPMADGDVEQLGVGVTLDEAACRALVQLPHDWPVG